MSHAKTGAAVLVMIAIVLELFCWLMISQEIRDRRRYPEKAEGTVVEIKVFEGEEETEYLPVVSLEVSGRQVLAESRRGFISTPLLAEGDRIAVRLDPDDTSKVWLPGFDENLSGSLYYALFICLVVVPAFTFLYLWKYRRELWGELVS